MLILISDKRMTEIYKTDHLLDIGQKGHFGWMSKSLIMY